MWLIYMLFAVVAFSIGLNVFGILWLKNDCKSTRQNMLYGYIAFTVVIVIFGAANLYSVNFDRSEYQRKHIGSNSKQPRKKDWEAIIGLALIVLIYHHAKTAYHLTKYIRAAESVNDDDYKDEETVGVAIRSQI